MHRVRNPQNVSLRIDGVYIYSRTLNFLSLVGDKISCSEGYIKSVG